MIIAYSFFCIKYVPNTNSKKELLKEFGKVFSYFDRWTSLSSFVATEFFFIINDSWSVVSYFFKGGWSFSWSFRRSFSSLGFWVLNNFCYWLFAFDLNEIPFLQKSCIVITLLNNLWGFIFRDVTCCKPIIFDLEVMSSLVLSIESEFKANIIHWDCGVIFLNLL